MTILYSASELEAFNRSSTNVGELTLAGSFDATYAREAVRAGNGTSTADFAETPLFTPFTTGWIHFERYQSAGGVVGGTALEVQNSAATPVFRLQHVVGTALQPQYWSGSAWTNLGAAIALSNTTRHVFDVKLIAGAAGSYEVWLNGILVGSGSGMAAAVTNFAKAKFYNTNPGATAGNSPHISQLVIADTSTISWKAQSKPATSNGTDVDGTGGFTEISEAVLDDAAILTLANAGQHSSVKSAARAVPVNYVVKGLTVTARAKCGATGPTQMKFYVTIGGTRYYSPAITLTTTFAPYQYTWELDPSTGTTWTKTAVEDATLQWGFEAA